MFRNRFRSGVVVCLFLVLASGQARADFPPSLMPSDDPGNYKNWIPWCKPLNVEQMRAKINNLVLRIKKCATDAADLEANSEANSAEATKLIGAAAALEEVAASSFVCLPIAATAAVSSGALSVGAAFAELAAQSDDAKVDELYAEEMQLREHLKGWLALYRYCCNKDTVIKTQEVLDDDDDKSSQLIREHRDRSFQHERISATDMKRYLGTLSPDALKATCDAARSGGLDALMSAENRTVLLGLVTADGRLK